MKRALRLFGNRLGNCAYDKLFLKEVKGRPAGSTNNLVRAANYPELKKVSVEHVSSTVNAASTVHTSVHPNHPHPHHPLPAQHQEIIFDDSVFDNSMMISEEDFVLEETDFMIDEGKAGVANATFPNAASTGMYPLPPRRK